jgi:hypothetical protein
MLRILSLAIIAFLLAGPLAARPSACWTSINGERKPLLYESDDNGLRENRSQRERLFGGTGKVTCPGYVTLRALTPGLSDSQRTPFCLKYDKRLKTYAGFAVGPRDAYVSCRAPYRTFCQRVNATKEEVEALADLGSTILTASHSVVALTGLKAVEHSSGALILTGSSGYISGTIGSFLAGTVATLTAPATATATLVTVVAIGGSVYYCSE